MQLSPLGRWKSPQLHLGSVQATICRGIKGFTAAIWRQHASHRAQHKAARTMQHLQAINKLLLEIMPDESVVLLLLVFFSDLYVCFSFSASGLFPKRCNTNGARLDQFGLCCVEECPSMDWNTYILFGLPEGLKSPLMEMGGWFVHLTKNICSFLKTESK